MPAVRGTKRKRNEGHVEQEPAEATPPLKMEPRTPSPISTPKPKPRKKSALKIKSELSSTLLSHPLSPESQQTDWRHPSELPFVDQAEWDDSKIWKFILGNRYSIGAFTYDPRNKVGDNHFFKVTRLDGTTVILPTRYRAPLLWVTKYLWSSIQLVCLAENRADEWAQYKFSCLHVSRLCKTLLDHAQDAAALGVDRRWRCAPFDRALIRYNNYCLVNTEDAVEEFWSINGEAVFVGDALAGDWKRWALKGFQGFALTQEEIDRGMSAQDVVEPLTAARGWKDDVEGILNITPPSSPVPAKKNKLPTGSVSNATTSTLPDSYNPWPTVRPAKARAVTDIRAAVAPTPPPPSRRKTNMLLVDSEIEVKPNIHELERQLREAEGESGAESSRPLAKRIRKGKTAKAAIDLDGEHDSEAGAGVVGEELEEDVKPIIPKKPSVKRAPRAKKPTAKATTTAGMDTGTDGETSQPPAKKPRAKPKRKGDAVGGPYALKPVQTFDSVSAAINSVHTGGGWSATTPVDSTAAAASAAGDVPPPKSTSFQSTSFPTSLPNLSSYYRSHVLNPSTTSALPLQGALSSSATMLPPKFAKAGPSTTIAPASASTYASTSAIAATPQGLSYSPTRLSMLGLNPLDPKVHPMSFPTTPFLSSLSASTGLAPSVTGLVGQPGSAAARLTSSLERILADFPTRAQIEDLITGLGNTDISRAGSSGKGKGKERTEGLDSGNSSESDVPKGEEGEPLDGEAEAGDASTALNSKKRKRSSDSLRRSKSKSRYAMLAHTVHSLSKDVQALAEEQRRHFSGSAAHSAASMDSALSPPITGDSQASFQSVSIASSIEGLIAEPSINGLLSNTPSTNGVDRKSPSKSGAKAKKRVDAVFLPPLPTNHPLGHLLHVEVPDDESDADAETDAEGDPEEEPSQNRTSEPVVEADLDLVYPESASTTPRSKERGSFGRSESPRGTSSKKLPKQKAEQVNGCG